MNMRRCNRRQSGQAGGSARKRGFTLAELLAVMLIMVILMGMAVSSFYGMGRGSRMRGAVANFNTVLSLARQYAITRGEPLTVKLVESSSEGEINWRYEILDQDDTMVRPTQYLPPGIRFLSDNNSFTFMPDGSLENGNHAQIDIEDEAGHRIEFHINGLTGMVRIIEPGV